MEMIWFQGARRHRAIPGGFESGEAAIARLCSSGIPYSAPQGALLVSNGLMRFLWIMIIAVAVNARADERPTPTPPESSDDLYKVGQQLFDQFAPPEVKQEYEFPSKADWDQFAARLQQALDGTSLGDLAAHESEAKAALAALRSLPGTDEYADWLTLRIDEIEAARMATIPEPSLPEARVQSLKVPYYGLWLRREQSRPLPPGSSVLMPKLRAAFSAEGVPPDLAWIAEVESNFNSEASSPAGAKGLFQLMPGTARALGLSTLLPDERANPEKSARAAAHYLHALFVKFGDWPLALAAYNAGEGRVARLLASRGASDFSGVASGLPSETRMYVPKVCALVAVRTGTLL
jgi:membrane-bound lytic murein transglycosylase D